MAKTYIDTVKYVIHSDVNIDGLVERPDVVGAIFGQTEGLLGDELDLRDLQKNGRIGRIEVDLNPKGGRTVGSIKIPSSLDMVETCIIAAALETVDRVGPCEAQIRIQKIEDTRNVKRKMLVDRAKSLLKNLLNTEIPESKEISGMVRDEVKTAEVVEYGPEKLASGPNIEKVNEIIFVEGRADVINLVKNDISNVIAIGGARVPKSIVELSKQREVTVFLDGDRGGDIILNELIHGGVEIDFIARAPPGKEVEELTRKELIKCIRNKVPYEQSGEETASIKGQQKRYPERREQFERKEYEQARSYRIEGKPVVENPVFENMIESIGEGRGPIEPPAAARVVPFEAPKPAVQLDKESLLRQLEELSNTLKARLYNSKGEMIREIPVRDVIKALEEERNISAIVFDGIITQRLVDLAASKDVSLLIGVRLGNVNKKPDKIEVITKRK